MEPRDILNEQGKREWDRIMPLLEGHVDELDRTHLEIYCSCWATARSVLETIEEDGFLIRAANGGLQVHPAARIARQNLEEMQEIMYGFARRVNERLARKN